MYILEKENGFVFCGYGYNERPQWDTIHGRDFVVSESFRVEIFLSEIAAVNEGNCIQNQFSAPVRVVEFSKWIEKNKEKK